jgi:hypothetical protein
MPSTPQTEGPAKSSGVSALQSQEAAAVGVWGWARGAVQGLSSFVGLRAGTGVGPSQPRGRSAYASRKSQQFTM